MIICLEVVWKLIGLNCKVIKFSWFWILFVSCECVEVSFVVIFWLKWSWVVFVSFCLMIFFVCGVELDCCWIVRMCVKLLINGSLLKFDLMLSIWFLLIVEMWDGLVKSLFGEMMMDFFVIKWLLFWLWNMKKFLFVWVCECILLKVCREICNWCWFGISFKLSLLRVLVWFWICVFKIVFLMGLVNFCGVGMRWLSIVLDSDIWMLVLW